MRYSDGVNVINTLWLDIRRWRSHSLWLVNNFFAKRFSNWYFDPAKQRYVDSFETFVECADMYQHLTGGQPILHDFPRPLSLQAGRLQQDGDWEWRKTHPQVNTLEMEEGHKEPEVIPDTELSILAPNEGDLVLQVLSRADVAGFAPGS